MPTISQQLETLDKDTRAEARAAYLAIVQRAAVNASEESDAAVLIELLAQIGKSRSDFDRDLRNWSALQQAQANAAAIPDFEKRNEAIAAAHAAAQTAYEGMQAAQKFYNDCYAALMSAQGLQRRAEMAGAAIREAKEACGDLLPDWQPPVEPVHFPRSRVGFQVTPIGNADRRARRE